MPLIFPPSVNITSLAVQNLRTVYLLSVRVRQFISEFIVNLRKQPTFWRRYLWLTRETNEEIPY